jgi:hypothetical protein
MALSFASPRTLLLASLISSFAGVLSSLAYAQEEPNASTEPQPATASRARQAVNAGSFMLWTRPARSDAQGGLVQLSGGYGAEGNAPSLESSGAVALGGRIQLRGGLRSVGSGGIEGDETGRVRPFATAQLDVLRQETAGLDLAFSLGYDQHGFNEVPALIGGVALDRFLGPVLLLANFEYGAGLEQGERYGDVRLAASYLATDQLRVGLESRGRIDLERDLDEPPGETDWQFLVSPIMTVLFGDFVVSGGAGVSALQYRLRPEVRTGALVQTSVGIVF